MGFTGNDTIKGGKGQDIVHGDDFTPGAQLDGNDQIAGGDDRDQIFGEAGDDVLSGGNVADFFSISVQDDHSEWNDHSRDILSGGEGHDTYLISSDFIAVETPLTDPEVVKMIDTQIDLIDALDSDFTALFQFKDLDGNLQSFTLTAEMVEAFMTATGPNSNVFGVITYHYQDGDWTGNIEGVEFGNDLIITIDLGRSQYLLAGGLYGINRLPRDPIDGTGDDDYLQGSNGDDTINGGGGNDSIYGGRGNDRVDGDAGGNSLRSPASSSLVNVSIDEFVLDGTSSSYVFSTALDGSIIVMSAIYGTDTLFNMETAFFTADQAVIALSDLVGVIPKSATVGSSGADHLFGSTGEDAISGLSGNDTLDGMDGNDHLFGGAGDDILDGGLGDDTYYYAKDDGNDVIQDGAEQGATDILTFEDLNLLDLTMSRSGEDLVITVNSRGETITLNAQYYDADLPYGIEKLIFADGTSLDLDHSPDTTWIYGTAGTDAIDGTWGKDYIIGGLGDDVMNGGAGGDVYIYAKGDGNDTINDDVGFLDNLDVLRFTDLTLNDLSFWRVDEALFIGR